MGERTATSAAPAARRGLRRIVLGIGIIAAALVLLAVAATWIALASLDSETMRGWIQGSVREATGLDVSWARLDVSVRGAIRMDDLRIANTAPWAEHEPDMLSVARLEADVAPGALLGGRIRVARLTLRDVHASWVGGPQGSSLDALATQPSGSGSAPVPWGLKGPRGLDASVEELSVAGISLVAVSIAEDATASRLDLGGLAIEGRLALAPGGDILGRLRMTGPEAGILVRVNADKAPDAARGPAGEARILIDATTEASVGQVALRLRTHVASQSVSDQLPSAFAALALNLAVAEVPDGLRFDVGALDVLAGVVAGRLSVIAGGADGRIHLPDGALRIDLSALPADLRALLPVRLEGPAVLDVTARDLALSTETPFLGPGGALTVDSTVHLLDADLGGHALTVQTEIGRASCRERV